MHFDPRNLYSFVSQLKFVAPRETSCYNMMMRGISLIQKAGHAYTKKPKVIKVRFGFQTQKHEL